MRILIADDHPFTLMDTNAFVESLGYKVEDVCSNGILPLTSFLPTNLLLLF